MTFTEEQLTSDGNTLVFTTSHTPAAGFMLHMNGIKQEPFPSPDGSAQPTFTRDGKTITFDSDCAPRPRDICVVSYWTEEA